MSVGIQNVREATIQSVNKVHAAIAATMHTDFAGKRLLEKSCRLYCARFYFVLEDGVLHWICQETEKPMKNNMKCTILLVSQLKTLDAIVYSLT